MFRAHQLSSKQWWESKKIRAISWDYGTFRLPKTNSSNAHAQPSNGVRCLSFGLTLPLLSYFICEKALTRLRGSAGSPEPSLVAYVINTIISWVGLIITNWAAAWQNQQNDRCAQRRLRSAWASVQSDQSLRCPYEEALGPQLPRRRTAKTLIRHFAPRSMWM